VNTQQSFEVKQAPIVKSYLYKSVVVAPPIEIESQAIVPDIIDTAPDNVSPNNSTKPQANLTTTNDARDPVSTVNPTKTIETAKESTPINAKDMVPLSPTTVLTSDSSTKSIMLEPPLQQMVAKHLQGIQSDYSQQQALERRQQKISPTINTETAVDTFLPLEIAPTVTVDCGNSAKKVLANISTVTGGRVKCRTSNQFQSFIDKRLAKPTLSDENKSEGK
jgi:hypothetical protein